MIYYIFSISHQNWFESLRCARSYPHRRICAPPYARSKSTRGDKMLARKYFQEVAEVGHNAISAQVGIRILCIAPPCQCPRSRRK